MTTYRAFQVSGNGDFRLVERTETYPAPGWVRVRVEACGVCHSDTLAVYGMFRPSADDPIVPGHEIAGVIEAVGPGVRPWRVGDRVGVPFLNGPCYQCDNCRRGDFVSCADQPLTGTTVDGGYAEITYARASGLVRLPAEISSIDAAPLLCAGITVYQALQDLDLPPGALVAIQGIGGLGHLAIQFAAELGYRVAAVGRGTGKAWLAAELGATLYIDSTHEDPATVLQQHGGAAAALFTGASTAGIEQLLTGLAPRGRLVIAGAGSEPISVQPANVLFPLRTIQGTVTGTAIENEDQITFAVRHDIRPMTEVMPLSEAPQAFERMLSGDARFRVVLDTAK